jgi:hypothetical protein
VSMTVQPRRDSGWAASATDAGPWAVAHLGEDPSFDGGYLVVAAGSPADGLRLVMVSGRAGPRPCTSWDMILCSRAPSVERLRCS